jgi:gliding motility-associated-like protein
MKNRSLIIFSGRFIFILLLCAFSNAKAVIYQVTTTTFAGVGSISQAVTNANASPGKDTIYFSIAGAAPFTIILTTNLNVSESLLIDGTSQTGYNSLAPKPVVELKNSPAMAIIVSSGAAEIRALALNNCSAAGIVLTTSNNIITGCYIGIALDGVTDSGNAASGIDIASNSNNNIIGGSLLAERNVISGNSAHGISITTSSNNTIVGNYIGTNAAGTAAVGNSANGIQFSANSINNIVGGTSPTLTNVISGNSQHGIEVNACPTNRFFGNIIGLQANGASPLGNLAHGILIIGGSNTNKIGGGGIGSGNVISSNGSIGINIINSTNTIVKNNIIGTSISTTIARGNTANGIQLQGSPQTIIGGDHLTEGNIISASGGGGINIDPGSDKTVVKGNYIGTDISGTMALGNNVIGIILKSDSCTIGSNTPGEGNVIVDTKIFCGILIADANANTVKGNIIGAGADTSAIPNKTDGINISVETNGKTANNNIVRHNVIAYNTTNGINVGKALNNNINNNEIKNDLRFNSIFCNQNLGISLNLVAPADQGNNGKTAPVINNALSTSSKVVGLANGLLPSDTIDIYEMVDCPSCDINPQGKKYIASVIPDASGNWSYNNGSPITGSLIATATDVAGNTSQFSLCFTPCKAKAAVNPSEYSVQLEMNNTESVTLTSNSSFSNLTTVPGKVFWSIGKPDTTGAALFSTAAAVNFNFSVKGGSGTYSTGLYQVYLIAQQSGCMDTVEVDLNVFFIPNMITPNGDDMNDAWAVGNAPGQFDAKIYNRWGELVYYKTDYTNEWNGSGLGDGVYYYLLEDKTQPKKAYKGWVQVLK